MFLHYNALNSVKMELLDHYARTANLQLDAIDRSLKSYSDAAAHAFKTLNSYDAQMGIEPIRHLVKAVYQNQLHVTDKANEHAIRLAALQTHGFCEIARKMIDETASFAPPFVEASLNATEAVLDTGESLANALGSASVAALESFDQAVAPKATRARTPRQR